MMKHLALLTFLFTFALMTPSSAEAQAACFDWTCNTATGQCTFDASCSDDTPLNFRWTYGDGSPTESIWQSPLASHTYAAPTATATVTLSVGYLFIGYYDVTCLIRIRNVISPPVAFMSGTCS